MRPAASPASNAGAFSRQRRIVTLTPSIQICDIVVNMGPVEKSPITKLRVPFEWMSNEATLILRPHLGTYTDVLFEKKSVWDTSITILFPHSQVKEEEEVVAAALSSGNGETGCMVRIRTCRR